MTYTLFFVKGEKAKSLEVKWHDFDARIPGFLIARTTNDKIIYLNMQDYSRIEVDGKEFDDAAKEQN
jgi:hypothetical protein